MEGSQAGTIAWLPTRRYLCTYRLYDRAITWAQACPASKGVGCPRALREGTELPVVLPRTNSNNDMLLIKESWPSAGFDSFINLARPSKGLESGDRHFSCFQRGPGDAELESTH